MNVTFSIDEETLARAKELASQRGVSLDQLIQEYLSEWTSRMSAEEMIEKLNELWNNSEGNSGGRTWTREELHERSDLR
jgi:hypothetical protein